MVSKQHITILLFLFLVHAGKGQTTLENLSLNKAYQLLENRYPSLKDGQVLNTIHQKEQNKLDKNRLPDVYLRADGRLQSESASIDLPPGTELPFEIDLPLYSVKAYLEAQYNILDGGMTKAQKNLKAAQLEADLQDIEVNRYGLRERVNQLFVNIAILRQQNKLFDISLNDLRTRKSNVAAAVEEGVVLESEITKIRVKELELLGQQDNVNYRLLGLTNSLSELLGVELSDGVNLAFPEFANPNQIPEIDRPEQKYFQLKQAAILANGDLIKASRKPRLSAYAQGGVGNPNPVNFLDNGTAPYAIVGLQFNWKLTDWKKSKLDKEILNLQAQRLQHAQESFEFNLQTREANYLAERTRLQKQLKSDDEIARLQTDILEQLAIQLDEGVITSTDYLIQVNAELKARQNILIHQTELLKLQIEFWNERGGK